MPNPSSPRPRLDTVGPQAKTTSPAPAAGSAVGKTAGPSVANATLANAASAAAPTTSSTGGRVDAGPWWRHPSRRTQLIAAAICLVLLAGAAIWRFHPTSAPVASKGIPRTPRPTPTPTPPLTLASPLTGLQIDPAASKAPIAGVMIENLYPDARPQSGLSAAGVVYEALAEGGITRFLALFQQPYPDSIGPVRSLRPYYLDWGLEYQAPVAHAGGSEPAMAAIGPLGLKDINALVYDGSYFFRTRDRYAPHNLYTNNDKLSGIVAKLGFATEPSFTPLPRKADAPSQAAAHPTITINFSTSPYAVRYNYDAPSNSYARTMGGAPHIDRNTGKQIMVKNVVVEYVPATYGTQSNGKPETDYHLIGQGKALVFVDGGVVEGTWNKSSDSAQTRLLDATGKPIALNAGNTWFSVVPTGNAVTY